jgi:hypothetical protein
MCAVCGSEGVVHEHVERFGEGGGEGLVALLLPDVEPRVLQQQHLPLAVDIPIYKMSLVG